MPEKKMKLSGMILGYYNAKYEANMPEKKMIEFDTLSKWERKRKRICLGRILGYYNMNSCSSGCCGDLHIKKSEDDCEGLDARCKSQPFLPCDCYPIETAIKLAWKIKMGLVKYDS